MVWTNRPTNSPLTNATLSSLSTQSLSCVCRAESSMQNMCFENYSINDSLALSLSRVFLFFQTYVGLPSQVAMLLSYPCDKFFLYLERKLVPILSST